MKKIAVLVITLTCFMKLDALAQVGETESDGTTKAGTAKVEKLYAEGVSYYKEGKYNLALSKFKEAYSMFPEANLLFNMARCYEAMGSIDDAISSYRSFLDQPNIDASTAVKARGKLRTLEEAKIGAKTTTATTSTPEPSYTKDIPSKSEPPEAAKPTSRSLSPWTWITLATGVGTGIIGAVFLGLGNTDYNKVKDADNYGAGVGSDAPPAGMTRSEAVDLIDSGDSKVKTGYVFLGIGGAILVTSGILFLLDGSREKEAAPVSVGMSPLPGGGNIVLHGSF